MTPDRSTPHVAAVVLGAALYGAIIVAGRMFARAGFSLFEIAIVGGLFGAITLAPLLVWKPALRIRRADRGLFLGYAAMGTVLQISQFLGIVVGVPVAVVGLLLYTQPLWTVLLSRLWLAERITARKVGALALGAVGIAFLVDPRGATGTYSPLGIAAALLGGVMLSIWVILGRTSALRGNHPITTTFGYHAGSTIGLLLVLPLLRIWPTTAPMMRFDPGVFLGHWEGVAIYTLVVNIAPALLVMWGMRGLQASTVGMLLLIEPVAAAALAWWLFGEAIGGNVWIGGALILGCNAVLLLRRR